MNKRTLLQTGLALALLFGLAGGAEAADKVKAVASFSIVGDMVRQVGGDRVNVVTLVGPDGDAQLGVLVQKTGGPAEHRAFEFLNNFVQARCSTKREPSSPDSQ